MDNIPDGGPVNFILRALTPGQGARHNLSLRKLSILYRTIFQETVTKDLTRMLEANNTLEELELCGRRLTRKEWKLVFDSLKSNKCLKTLNLSNCANGPDEAFGLEDIRGLLQMNHTICEVGLKNTPLEYNAEVKMLMRKRKLAGFRRSLDDNLKLAVPCIGRLLLCGYPHAGKTTLQRNMVAVQESRMGQARTQLQNTMEEGTRGIEISMFRTSDNKRITIWDVVGKEGYHAMHDSQLFPNNDACVFIFVFRAFDKAEEIDQPEMALKRLETELRYWLSFITSNWTKGTRQRRPKVSVVLTHIDQLSYWFSNAHSYKEWAKGTTETLRKDFEGEVEVQQQIHAVNCFELEHAREVLDHALKCFHDIFTTLPKVPAAWEEMSLVLAEWTASHNYEPLIRSEKFFDLCEEKVEAFRCLRKGVPDGLPSEAVDIQEDHRRQAQKGLLSYLHGVGCIINVQDSNYIVVNANWFGQVFLGQLFKPGNKSHRSVLSTKNGIVAKHLLENFWRSFISSGSYEGFDHHDLIELMKELKLCYEINVASKAGPQFFIPCTLSDPDNRARLGRRQLKWETTHKGSNPIYIGLRFQSKDRLRTFLSPGVFQGYQVHLRQFLSSLHDNSIEYVVEQNLIRVKNDGMEMLVESSGESEDYVDILVRSFISAIAAKQYIYKYLVDELRSFCVSPAGCPGVVLEEAILRPVCVEKLTRCIYRKDQAVSSEILKANAVNKLVVMPAKALQSEVWKAGAYASTITRKSIEKNMTYQRFPAVPLVNLDEEWIKMTDLIHLIDMEEGIVRYQTSVTQQVHAIYEAVDELQSNNAVPVPKAGSSSIEATMASVRFSMDHRGMLAGPSNQQLYEQLQMKRSLLDFEKRLKGSSAANLKLYRAEVPGVGKENLDTLEEYKLQMAMNDVQMLHQVRQIALIEKLDQLLLQLEAARALPRIPYITDSGVGRAQRLVCFIRVGTPLKLQFMCEDPSNIHYVKDQTGLDIVDLKLGRTYEVLRPIVRASINLLFILVKAGLHVAAGIGNAIPNFTTFEGAVPLTAGALGAEPLVNEIKVASAAAILTGGDISEAWHWIERTVRPLMVQGRIPEVFQLFQVQYKADYLTELLAQRRVYWVCAKCRQRAESAGQLDEFNDSDREHIPRRLVTKEEISKSSY